MQLEFVLNPGGVTCSHVHVYRDGVQIAVMTQDDFNPAVIVGMSPDAQKQWAAAGSAIETQIKGRVFFAILDQGLQTVEQVVGYLEGLEFVG